MSTSGLPASTSSPSYDANKYEERIDCEACRIKMIVCLYEVGKPHSGCVRCSKGRNKSCIIQDQIGRAHV